MKSDLVCVAIIYCMHYVYIVLCSKYLKIKLKDSKMSDKLDQYNLFDIGECQSCNNSYSNPHILNCLHTFCFECIKNMSRSSDPKCAICREEFDLQSDGLPQHYNNRSFEDLANLRNLMGSVKIGRSICDLCKKAKANSYCRECKMIMCQHDANTHAKSSKEKHNIFELTFLNDYNNIFKLLPENTRNQCKQHEEKQIQLYCYICDDVLCSECANESHLKNRCYVNEVDESFLGRREMVGNIHKDQEKRIKEINSNRKRLFEILQNIAKQEEKLLKNIDDHFETYIDQLRTRHNKLNDTVKTVFANRKAEIENAMESEEKFINESKRLQEMTSFFLNDLPGTHLFPPGVAMTNRMDMFERNHSVISTDQNTIEFSFSGDSQFVNDPERIGKFNFRFPLGFETPRYTIDLISKIKLPKNVKIHGITRTTKGELYVLLYNDKNDRNSEANTILRLNSCFKPLKKNKFLEQMTALDDKTTISHFNATSEGKVLIVDRNKKMLQSMKDGSIISAMSGNSDSSSSMLDPFNVITGKGKGFIVYNKEPHMLEFYNSDSKLQHSFELYPVVKTAGMPATPTTVREHTFGVSPEPSHDFIGGFINISHPSKRATPETIQRVTHEPCTNLQIATNSFGDIYYVFENKGVVKRFSEKGEELKEFKFADSKTEGPTKCHSSSKVPLPSRPALERQGTLRKNKLQIIKPNNLTIPLSNLAPSKPASMKTLIAIDYFDNIYIYQRGHIYVLDRSLESVRTRGRIDFEPDFMMISEMGHLMLVTQDDAIIRVY